MAFKQESSAETRRYLGGNGADNDAAGNSPVNGAQGSNPAALEELWRIHAKNILRVTQRITNNREDAEDALQDSFLRAHAHLQSFDGRSSFATWFTRIAINSALMVLRKRARGPKLFSLGATAESGAELRDRISSEQGLSPEAQYARLEQQSVVRGTVARLRPSLRRALELQIEERPVKEIAEAMGLSVSATKSRIFHAKAALRKSLEQKVSRRSGGMKRLQPLPA
jgi:RNA polymerase sigma factor (sigma-70 family)